MESEVLIKGAVITDIEGPHNGRKSDVLIENGRIKTIAPAIEAKNATVVERENLHISPGWLDIGPQTGEPGLEHRETLETLANAAVAGGFTSLVVAPNTEPAIQRRADIDSMLKKSVSLPVRIHPMGAVTRDCSGSELTEFIDMAQSGAAAFSNGRETITDAGLIGRAFLYASSVNKPVVNRPLNRAVNPFGQMHEGEISVRLGLEGLPGEAETISLFQDISMLRYSGGALISLGVTSAESVKLLTGTPEGFFAATPAMNLLYADSELSEFDTSFKVLPPLRSESDRQALIKAVKEGHIQIVFSNHDPMEEEVKKVEFGLAEFGASTIETAFPMAWTALRNDMKVEEVVALFCHNPRKAMGLDIPTIEEGKTAEITLFDPVASKLRKTETIRSKSKSVPAMGKSLDGSIYGTIIEGNIHLIE